MGIMFVIIGYFCKIDNADIEKKKFWVKLVDVFLSYVNILEVNDKMVDVV